MLYHTGIHVSEAQFLRVAAGGLVADDDRRRSGNGHPDTGQAEASFFGGFGRFATPRDLGIHHGRQAAVHPRDAHAHVESHLWRRQAQAVGLYCGAFHVAQDRLHAVRDRGNATGLRPQDGRVLAGDNS